MTVVAWLALAATLLLVPVPAGAGRRVDGLAHRGRLALADSPARRLRWPAVRGRTAAVIGCTLAALAVGVRGGAVLGIAAAVVAGTGAGSLTCATAQRRTARRRRELLAAVRLMVAELEAGSTPSAALYAAAASSPSHAAPLSRAAGTANSGGDIEGALLSGDAAELAPLAHAWRVGTLCGAPLAEVLGRVAADLADLDDQRTAVAVALAGPRSSSALLAGLPVVGLALGAAMGARPVQFLLTDPAGRALCCAGVILDAAGVFWTLRLIQRAQRE